jgi:hypothetical protein
MSGVLATTIDIIRTAVEITVETLEATVKSVIISWHADRYCDAVGLPPTQPAKEWAPAVADLRTRMEAASDPAQYAEIAKDAFTLLNGINSALSQSGGSASTDVADALYRAILPILLFVLPNAPSVHRSKSAGLIVYSILVGLVLIDQRFQESYPQGLMEQRFYALLRDLAIKAHWIEPKDGHPKDEAVDWPPILTDSVAVVFVILFAFVLRTKDRFKVQHWPERSRRWSFYTYGFDHPAIAGFEQALTLAQHAFTVVFAPEAPEFKPERFDTIEPQRPPEPEELWQITLVPVPKSIDPSGKGEIFLQFEAFSQINIQLGEGWVFKIGETPSFGALISTSGVQPIGDVGFQFEISKEWPDAPSTAGSSDSTVSFRATQIAAGAQISLEDLSASVRMEKGELAIGGGHWLLDYIPSLRFTFDLSASAGVLGGIQFTGGAGGDVLIPVNTRVPFFVGAMTVQAIHVRSFIGADAKTSGVTLEGTANLSVDLFHVLSAQVSGLGASYSIGTAPQGDGNVGGVARHGWNAVLPSGAGLAISAWKITGGGALFFDSVKDILSGAIELDVAGLFSLKGIGIYQRPTSTATNSWLALVTMEFPANESAFMLEGVGLLYGSDRGTSPEAFLAAIGNGNLSALLFGADLTKNAATYIAALETLFPAQKGISVVGILAKLSAAADMITLSLGVIIEYSPSAIIHTYIIGRLIAVCPPPEGGVKPDPKKVPLYIQADGVAFWDSATDTLDLRIQLNNSRIWGGELSGGASIFHSPKRIDLPVHGTYVSVGGFHPDYTPPPSIYVPARLTLAVSKGDHLKIQVQAYVAFTPSSIQVGIGGRLEAHLYGFGIRGQFNIDTLFGFDGNYSIGVSASVELLLGSETLAAVAFSGKLTGTGPTVLSGKVSVHFLFWTLSKSGSINLTDGDRHTPPDPDVAAAVAAAVNDSRNWENSGAPGLTLSGRQRDGVFLSPNAPIRFRQAVVPLNIAIQRFGSARLGAPQTLHIDHVKAGTTELTTQPVQNDFALGMFLDLTQEQMLATQGFETRDAGVEISRPFASGAAISTGDDFEEIMLDPKARPASPPVIVLSTVILQMTTVFAAPAAAPAPAGIRRERFTLVDSALKPQKASITMFEARTTVQAGWHIVPEAEAAP